MLGHGAQHAVAQILLPVERIDELVVRETARNRVHGEVAAREVVFDARRRVDDDLEVVAPRSSAALAPWRCELDPARRKLAQLPVARPEPQADALPGDLEVVDAAVRLEQRTKLFVIDAEDEEVRVLRVEPEQLVADGAADEIGVEPERADVVLELAVHSNRGDRFDL